MNELNIVGNKVLEFDLSPDLVAGLTIESLNDFEYKKTESEKYPIDSKIYHFRTPISLTSPTEGPGYQWIVPDTAFIQTYKNFILEQASNYFSSTCQITDCWYLLQTNEPWINNPVHQHLTADWVIVAFIKVSELDSIEFSDEGGNTEKYFPKPGTVLMFPATANHRPIPNTGDNVRISINCEIKTNSNVELLPAQISKLEICNTCDQLSSLKFCGQCKCFMPFKVKIPGVSCPLGKW